MSWDGTAKGMCIGTRFPGKFSQIQTGARNESVGAMSAIATSNSIQLTRLIKATRGCVFAAWTKPGQIKQWFGPSSCHMLNAKVDLRVGGAYRFRVFNEEFGEMDVHGEYREIEEPSKLVYTWRWEDDPDWRNMESLVTVELLEKDGQTEVRVTHEGFPSDESAHNHEQGWKGALDKLQMRATLAAEMFGPGRFSWNELLTGDVDAAAAFYMKLFGWETAKFAGMDYTMFKKNGNEVGGLMKNPMSGPSHWLSYVTVENADASAGRVREFGGSVCKAPFDIPGVGRIAIAQDPEGATFGVFQPAAK